MGAHVGNTTLSILLPVLCLVLASCDQAVPQTTTVPGVTPDAIVLGTSLPLGGHASFLGSQYLLGAQAYFKKVNEAGGVHGRNITIVVYDDGYVPAKTVTNTQRLIKEDKVFLLFNFVGTPTSIKILDIIEDSHIPAVGFFTGAESLRTPFSRNIFHIRDSYFAETEAAISYFVDQKGMKNISVMYQEDDFGLAVLIGVQKAMNRRNLETTATATFKRGTFDVEKAVERIEASDPEVVIMVGTYTPLAKFIRVCHENNFTPYFHTVSFVGSEAFGKEIIKESNIDQSQYEKIIVTQVVPSPFSSEYEGVEEYHEVMTHYFPEETPNYVSLEGYVNAKVITEGLFGAGSNLTRDSFIDAMETLQGLDIGIGKDIFFFDQDHTGLNGVYLSSVNEEGNFRIFQE